MITQTTVTERPILFSSPMVQGILAGKKHVTRRCLKPQPDEHDGRLTWRPPGSKYEPRADLWMPSAVWRADRSPCDTGAAGIVRWCPYGQTGDRLWVRESHWLPPTITNRMLRDGADTWPAVIYCADEPDDDWCKEHGWAKRPSIHMPRWASRITLQIESIRVERLQAITEEDAYAEGIEEWTSAGQTFSPIVRFHELWDEINGEKHPWSSNCWVWCVSFKRLEPTP